MLQLIVVFQNLFKTFDGSALADSCRSVTPSRAMFAGDRSRPQGRSPMAASRSPGNTQEIDSVIRFDSKARRGVRRTM